MFSCFQSGLIDLNHFINIIDKIKKIKHKIMSSFESFRD